MNFWKSLLPSNPPNHIITKGPVAILRERILQTILIFSFALSALVEPFLIRSALGNGLVSQTLILIAIFAALLALTTARKWHYRPRVFGFLALLFLISIFTFTFTLSNSFLPGISFLIVFVVEATILLGPTGGFSAILLSLLTTALVSNWMQNGGSLPIVDLAAPGWSLTGSAFLLAAGLISASISMLTLGLQRNLQHYMELSNDLQKQKEELSTSLQEKTINLERRLTEINTATEITRSFSSVLNTEALIQTVVDLIRDRLDLYYVGLFLVDQDRQYAVLKAGTGDAGRIMLANQHRLQIGGISMIGWSIANQKPRIALDVGQEGMHFNNPNLPDTRSELALPIIGRDKALGALTIQSTRENAFDEDDITILQGIADSLGIALENARLFEQSQKDLAEISALNRQYVQRNWYAEIAASGNLAYSYENHVTQKTGAAGYKIQIPVRLRDQTIGQIEIEKDSDEFNTDEIELVESISSQTAIALESARLLQESQRKASQEEMIVELTSRFSQALDIDDVLQTAVKELGRLPSISEVSIQLAGQNQRNKPQHLGAGSQQEKGK